MDQREDCRKLKSPGVLCKLHSEAYSSDVKAHKVLVFCKPFDSEVIESFYELNEYISEHFKEIEIYVDSWVLKELQELKLKPK